jgi:hypothetical protein
MIPYDLQQCSDLVCWVWKQKGETYLQSSNFSVSSTDKDPPS